MTELEFTEEFLYQTDQERRACLAKLWGDYQRLEEGGKAPCGAASTAG